MKPEVADFTAQSDEDWAGLDPGTNMLWYVKLTKSGNFNTLVEYVPADVQASACNVKAGFWQLWVSWHEEFQEEIQGLSVSFNPKRQRA